MMTKLQIRVNVDKQNDTPKDSRHTFGQDYKRLLAVAED